MPKIREKPLLLLAHVCLCLGMLLIDIIGWCATSVIPVAAHALNRTPVERPENISWPNDQALPIFAQPLSLDVTVLDNTTADMSLMLATLQGIVNRTRPQIYLIEGHPSEGGMTWLQGLGVPYILHTDPWEVVNKYFALTKGIIVYDPGIPDTINVATTMAGLEDGMVVSPILAQRLSDAPYHLPILEDLRGKFQNDLEANTWQIENLWPRTTHRMLIGLEAGFPSPFSTKGEDLQVANTAKDAVPAGYLRDYAVANRAMVFWLPVLDADTAALFRKLLSMVAPGTPYLGWFDNETRGVRMTSQYGVYVLAADQLSNLTVFSGIKAPASVSDEGKVALPALKNKIYVTITMSDGDNLQYDQHRMRQIWDSAERGSVPLNWTVSPLLYDAAPAILQYYRQTATPNDLLIAGPSGAGYFYPSEWPARHLEQFLHSSDTYLKKTGLHIAFVLDDKLNLPADILRVYRQQFHVAGILHNWWYYGSQASNLIAHIPLSTQLVASTRTELLATIQQNAANWNGRSPFFIAAMAIAWSLEPADIKYVIDHLGPNYIAVRGDQFFQLMNKAC